MGVLDALLEETKASAAPAAAPPPVQALAQAPAAVQAVAPPQKGPLDDLLSATSNAASPMTGREAPMQSEGPLSGLLQEVVATDPSLQPAKDVTPPINRIKENPFLAKAQETIFGKKLPSPTRVVEGFQFSDIPLTFAKGALDIAKFPGDVSEAIQNLYPEKYGDFLPFEYFSAQKKAAAWVEKKIMPEEDPDAAWYEGIDSALGSAATFIAGGGVAKGLSKAAPYITSAILGGATMGNEQYEDAIAKGATPEEAGTALAAGTALGLPEAIPGGLFLGKLNKFSGGKMGEILDLYNQSKEKGVILESVIGMLTEATQEGFETLGGNWIAKQLAGYDPNRTMMENFWTSVLTGGVTGGMIGGGIAQLRKGTRKQAEADLEELANLKLATGDPINDLSGPMVPVGDYPELNAAQKQMEEEMTAEAALSGARIESDFGPGEAGLQGKPTQDVRNLKMKEKDAAAKYFGNTAGDAGDIISPVLDEKIDESVEKGLGKKPDGTTYTVREALQKQPVVAVGMNPYVNELRLTEDNLASLEKQIKNYATINKITFQEALKRPDLKGVKIAYEKQQTNSTALRSKVAIAQRILGEIKNYSAAFRKVYSPDFKMMVTNVDQRKGAREAGGYSGITHGIELVPGSGVKMPIGQIYINMDDIVTSIYNDRGLKTSGSQDSSRRWVYLALNHELGHAIATQNLKALRDKVRTGTPEEKKNAYNMFAYLKEDYGRWLNEASTSPQSFLNRSLIPAGKMGRGALSDKIPLSSNMAFPVHSGDPNAKVEDRQQYKSYLISFDEYFADMTARLAQQGKFADPTMTEYFKPVLAQYKTLFAAMPEYAQKLHGKNWEKFLETKRLDYKVKEKLEELMGAKSKTLIDAINGLLPGYDPKNYVGLKQHLDRWNKGMQLGMNLIQMVKENPHVAHWGHYLNAVVLWQNEVRNINAESAEVLRKWRKLGKKRHTALSEVFFDEAERKLDFTPAELAQRLDAGQLAVYSSVRKMLNNAMEQMQQAALRDAELSFHDQPEVLKNEIAEITKEFNSFKGKGYFPYMRYGRFTIVAKAKAQVTYNGRNFKPGDLITFPVFENQKQRDDMVVQLKRELGTSASVSASEMRETDNVIQGMPRSLLRSLRKKMLLSGPLTTDQELAFTTATQENEPFRNFRKQMAKKRGIFGYSEDGMRSLASYMQGFAAHIARVKYADMMREPIDGMQQDVDIIIASGGRAQERQQMQHWMKRHFEYIMNPANELAGLRSLGFVAFLGFGVKSAAVNLTQILTTTAPYLAARYGDVKAIAALSKATLTYKDWVLHKDKFIDALPSAEMELKQRLSFAIRSGAISPAGAHFALEGESTYSDTSNPKAKMYDLSKLKVADLSNAEVGKKVVEATIALEKDPAILQELNNLLSDPYAMEAINYGANEDLGLFRGAKALGYDGVLFFENDDITEPSTVNIFGNMNKIKEIDKKTFNANRTRKVEDYSSQKARHGRLMAQGLHEGWIDQSLATELAIARSENNLDRTSYLPFSRRIWHTFSRWSAGPFHVVEKANRVITAFAAYDLEYARSENHAKAVNAAKEANWSTHYENSRWNRPEFMRGKKSVALLFKNYVQNTLYFATHDAGATRWWMGMLLLAGAMGMPGMEDIEDIVDFVVTGLNKIFGKKNPKFALRQELRENIDHLGLNPDIILHGFSQSSFGMGHLGELTGMPIPRFDLSQSFSMGNILPGTEMPKRLQQGDDPSRVLAQTAAEFGGALGNLSLMFYDAMTSTDPRGWKTVEGLMPIMSFKDMIQTGRVIDEGGVYDRSGAPIATFDPHDLRDSLELGGMALGFTPTKVSLGWERVIAAKDMAKYYDTQKSALLLQNSYTMYTEDREGQADIDAAIDQYNDTVPYPEMAIGAESLRESTMNYFKTHIKAGMGYMEDKKMLRLMDKVQATYPDPAGNKLKEPGTDATP